jgi:hypothetical protein
MKTTERKVAVAQVKSCNGLNQRIELLTVADMVHLFALAMGYRPDVAFALGVVARSVPEVQAGECDCTLEMAQKAVQMASLISECRETASYPADPKTAQALLLAVQHVHTVEQAYTDLCREVEGIGQSLADQYSDWVEKQEAKPTKKPSLFRRLLNYVTSGDMAK